jgi:biopolymer transport protein ExbB
VEFNVIEHLRNDGLRCFLLSFLIFPAWMGTGSLSYAQDAGEVVESAELDRLANPTAGDAGAPTEAPARGISVMRLLSQGGPLMIPIGVLSLLVVTLAVERFFGLRTGNVIPNRLVTDLDNMARRPDSFDPQAALITCHKYPSAASRVIQAMLHRCGRPPADVESAGADAAQREADRLGGPIRWLNLAAAVSPLIGLFGTVWGMIVAFHDLTDMPAGQNKAEALATGIYTALVTTVGGLAVAIPATIFAHWYEGRLLRLMRRIEELAFRVGPGLDRYAGRMRLEADGHLTNLPGAVSSQPPVVKVPHVAPPPVQAAVSASK